MYLSELLFQFEQIEDAGNGGIMLPKQFGSLAMHDRSLAEIEVDLFERESVELCKGDEHLTVSDFIEKIHGFVDEFPDAADKVLTIKDRSIIHLTQTSWGISPVILRDADSDAFIRKQIDNGQNWLKIFFDEQVSVNDIPYTERNYRRDYIRYIWMRDELTPHAEMLAEDENRQQVFLNAIKNYADEMLEE